MRIDTMKIIRIATYALSFCIPVLAYAADVVPAPAVVANNTGLFQWVLGISILLSLFLLSRQIKASEKNNDLQWEAIHSMNKAFTEMHDEFIEIRTEHKMNHKEKC